MENKKLITLLLSAFTALSLASCGNDNKKSDNPVDSPSETSVSASDEVKSSEDSSSKEASSSSDGLKKGEYDKAHFPTSGYTMNDFVGSTTSLQWNPLTWETADDNAFLAYLSSSLYDYQLNEAKDGYEIVSELANGLPTDVTAEYVGKLGIEEGDVRQAYRIPLNPDACWDNGDAITADDYIYTMQQQLDPVQLNRRADSFYGGGFAIHNAQEYLYAGQVVARDNNSYDEPYKLDTLVKGADGVYKTADGQNAYIAVNSPLSWLQGNSLKKYVDAYGATYFVMDNWDALVALANAQGLVPLTDEAFGYLASVISNPAWGEGEGYEFNYFKVDYQYPIVPWDEVGFQKVDDYTIDVILDNPLTEPEAFYVPYNMSSISLVHKATYESAWKENPDGTRSNLYGLDLDHTRSYGPYMLAYYEDGKRVEFTRNTNWWGYRAGLVNGAEAHIGQYQTTDITWDVIAQHSSALLAFESGQIDGIGLESADLDKYGSSDYLLYTPQSYTTKVSFNTDLDALREIEAEKADGKNRVVPTVKEFREALAFAIDREYFVGAFTSAAAAGFGMFNYMYQFFNEDGSTTAYRDSSEAKEALCKLYGVTYGPDGDYENLNEAYKALTGYDMDKARASLNAAYTVAKEAGLYTDGQDIEIQFNVYQNDEIYVKMVNYFDTQLKEAAKGTPFEGHVAFKMFVDDDYYNTMYAGDAQFIYTTWGGAAYDPYGILDSCYTDDHTGNGNQMEYGFDTSKVPVTITLKDKEYTFSLQAWAAFMNNNNGRGGEDVVKGLGLKRDDLSVDEKNGILATLEYTYLNSFVTIPVYYRQSASLYSKKISYGTTTYIDLIGFGGIRHMTYNYTDAEWAEFIKNADNLKY